jgi:hypothetical protein
VVSLLCVIASTYHAAGTYYGWDKDAPIYAMRAWCCRIIAGPKIMRKAFRSNRPQGSKQVFWY